MAVKIKSATGALLATPQVIWVHFDSTGLIYKHTWGTDRPAIADFDGDGFNEVGAVLSPAMGSPSGSLRLALIEHGTGPVGPQGAPTPVIATSIDLDDFVSNWTWHTYNHHQGFNFNVQASQVAGNALPPELFVHESEGGRIGLGMYWRVPGQIWPFYSRDTTGASTHFIHCEDVNSDGHDDLLANGVIDVWNGCEFNFLNSIGFYTNHTGVHNHADTVRPYDHDGDGVKDLVILHDGYDLLVQNPGLSCQSSLIWENVRKNDATEAVFHGQQAVIARLIDGPDAFGFDGEHIVTAPKGPPLYFNGSVVLNGNAQELVIANNGGAPAPVGPRGGLFGKINWDGGTTDEILSFSHNRYSVWRLTFDGTDPNLPYVWTEVFGHPAQNGPGTIGGFAAGSRDILGTPRDDLIVFGRYGVQIVVPCL